MFDKIVVATVDTETCGLGKDCIVYDIGYVIHDKKGNVLTENHALIKEIFTNATRMMGAFYAKKTFTHYAPYLDSNTISLQSWQDFANQFAADCEEHKVNVFAAYNARFDTRAIKQTATLLGANKFLPYKMDLLCIWKFACQTIFQSENYYALARQEGWISAAGNFKTSAEVAYRYLAPAWDFVEDHTALSDARIEKDILAKCFSRKKRIPYNELNSCWQEAQPKK